MPKLPEKSPLAQKLAGVKVPKKRAEPLWKGPLEDGITQSLLSRFIVCRERFRIHVCEGLKKAEGFNKNLGYGQMWHVCEEHFANSGNPIVNNPVAEAPWARALRLYCTQLCRENRLQQTEIAHWYEVCKKQFPLYINYWKKNDEVLDLSPVAQELVFATPYVLPSGRIVTLRGKFDSVDLIAKGPKAGIWLQENKTKGDINPVQIKRQLKFDLQTMLYLIALRIECHTGAHPDLVKGWNKKVRGVRYNVIKRPLSGGKGSIKQKQGSKNVPAETKEEYYARMATYIEAEPGEYFMRWRVEVSDADVINFKERCLNPLLEQLCDWWEFIRYGDDPWRKSDLHSGRVPGDPPEPFGIHYQTPFGIYNILAEGGSSDVDDYIETGSEVGLERTDDLYPELK